jgi:hypothetical protein
VESTDVSKSGEENHSRRYTQNYLYGKDNEIVKKDFAFS